MNIKIFSLVKLKPENEIRELLSKNPNLISPLGIVFEYRENQLLFVRRKASGGEILSCDVLLQTHGKPIYDTINVSTELVEPVIENVFDLNSFFVQSNKEYAYEESSIVYPKNERIPTEILNEETVEDLEEMFPYEELKKHLIRAMYALNAAEERLPIKNESRRESSPNNNRKPTKKIEHIKQKLDSVSSENGRVPPPSAEPKSIEYLYSNYKFSIEDFNSKLKNAPSST